ncbi:hypothetical protein [Fonticella tunisiensis]|uniref:Uncharacterized protein n=1 Tax=Fonticella tunisiensis TaxID=1096341 RepID=A0A4R7KTQ4_9CLOT|nr:hypothetical protein [Fonticella tunisiensis]TDT63403.1 hypothetical protein EDD71_102165 [Fonticella tunisiensis]
MERKNYNNLDFNKLIVSIIAQAVRDYKNPRCFHENKNTELKKKQIKESAISFLKSEDCRYMCDVLNIDHKKILFKLGLEGQNGGHISA